MKIRIAALVGVMVLLGLAGWSLMGDPVASLGPDPATNAPTVTLASADKRDAPDRGVGIVVGEGSKRASKRVGQAKGTPAEQETLRQAILRSVAASKSGAAAKADGNVTAEGDDPEPEPAPGNIKDRIGGRDALMKAINEDFLPLADECIAAAQERDPELAGMLAIGLTVAGDPELGSVVEAVNFGDRNELSEAMLLECVENTALSTFLPPPPEGVQQESFELTLPVQPARE